VPHTPEPAPSIRVEDAATVADGGPARLSISRIADVDALAARFSGDARVLDVAHGRVRLLATAEQVTAAAGDAIGAAASAAIAAWTRGSDDLVTPRGVLPCASRPVVMGVLNVTPDSFSDGGEHYDRADHPARAIADGLALVAAGADVVDVGGESTRPGADEVSAADEAARVLPVVDALAAAGVIVSIDTTKAAVAREGVRNGAVIVNDVSAGVLDADMLATVADLGVPFVLVHMHGTPRTMQLDPHYDDVVADVHDALAERIDAAVAAGVARDRLVVDPGIGFGKTLEHNLELLRRVREFTSFGLPVLIGTSRKSFIGRLTDGAPADDRLEGSLATAALAVAGGAAIVRVHDVAASVRAVTVAHAVSRGRPA